MRYKIKAAIFCCLVMSIWVSCKNEIKTKTSLQFYNLPVDTIKDRCFSMKGVLALKDSSLLVGLCRWNEDMENYQAIDFEQEAYIYSSNNHGKSFTKKYIGKGQLSNFSKTSSYIYTALHVLIANGHNPIDETKILRSADDGQTWDTLKVFEANITQVFAFTDDSIAFIENEQGYDHLYISTDGLLTYKHIVTGGFVRNIELNNGHVYFIHNVYKEIDSSHVFPNILNYEIKSGQTTAVKIPSSFETECFHITPSGSLLAAGIINSQYFFYESASLAATGHFSAIDQSHLNNPFKIYVEKNDIYILSEESILFRKSNEATQWYEYLENISNLNGNIYIKNKNYMVGSFYSNYSPLVYIIR